MREDRLRAMPGVDSVRGSLVTGRPEYRVTVDEERAKDIGLDVAEVGEALLLVQAQRVVDLGAAVPLTQ